VLFLHSNYQNNSNLQKSLAGNTKNKKKKFEITYLKAQDPKPKDLKQIVNSEVANKEKNDEAKYLSQFDNKTNRETVAKTVDSFYRGTKSSSNANQKSEKQKSQKKKSIANLKLADIGLGPEQLAKIEVAKRVQRVVDENAEMARASSNNDYVKNVNLGDITNLNTAEYKYYGFYARIRMQLEQYWSSELKAKSQGLFKKGRSIASGQELITNLEITIDQAGKIKKVVIVTTSGVQEIDEAAIDAFEKAGPFPNPPKDMVTSGEATLRWGFVVRS
jgi:protein TonB